MDTAPLGPLGPIPPSGPRNGSDEDRTTPAAPARRRGLRAVEAVAGLASGGLLILGVTLLVLQFLAPELAPGTGLTAAAGPGWGRVAAQLGVGVAGELVVLARRFLPHAVRAVLAAAVVVAAGAALWFAWWA